MSTVNVELEDPLAEMAKELACPIDKKMRELLILDLYREGHMSSGIAGPMLGMNKWDFIRYAGERGIPYIRYSAEEFEREMQTVRELLKSGDPLKS